MRFRQQRVITNLDAEKNFIQAETEFASQQEEIDALQVAPPAHAASHLPGGSDALTTATAGTIEPDATAAEGVAASFSRSDHRHAIATASASAITGTNAEGSSSSFARADHDHALQTPGCRVYRNSNESIANITIQAISFNSERYDPYNMHSTSSDTDKIYMPQAGVYQVTGNIRTEANTTGVRELQLIVNGSTTIAFNALEAVATDGGLSIMQITSVWKFAAGEYVQMALWQNSGGALNIESYGAYSPELAVHYLGAG